MIQPNGSAAPATTEPRESKRVKWAANVEMHQHIAEKCASYQKCAVVNDTNGVFVVAVAVAVLPRLFHAM